MIIAGGSFAFVLWHTYFARTSNPLSKDLLAKLNAEESLKADAIHHGLIIGPLKGGLVRDEQETRQFTIPEKETLVQLRLAIGAGDYQNFQATIQTAEGAEMPPLDDLKAKSISGERVVIVYLPANVLVPADYQLRLSGVQPDQQLKYLVGHELERGWERPGELLSKFGKPVKLPLYTDRQTRRSSETPGDEKNAIAVDSRCLSTHCSTVSPAGRLAGSLHFSMLSVRKARPGASGSRLRKS